MEQPKGLDLHVDVDRRPGRVGRSLEEALRKALRSGRLPAGTRLPGSRNLAADLGISRGTVVQVYAQLIAEGWLVGRPGSGTRVSPTPAAADTGPTMEGRAGRGRRPDAAAGHRPEAVDLRPGRPDIGAFPRAAWASAVRRVLTSADPELWDYGPPTGLTALREAVAGYVARTRGVRADPGRVIVVGGFAAGLALLGRALSGLGVREVATEDPGLDRHRRLLHAAGLATPPLEVGPTGADPDGLTARAGAALLTPAHQHPYGVVLAPRRRAAFVDWARRHDGYLIEDDYDGEFRYDQQPVGALQALAPDRVVYAGSASKSLAPGMRLGWLVVPAALHDPLVRAIEETGTGVPVIEQLALADLIERGEYDRHIRRVRLAYRRRRAELVRRLPAPLSGVAAGLHALLPVGSAGHEARLIEVGRYAGVRLHGLHGLAYWHRPSGERPAALVLGYATPPQHAWQQALDRLVEVIDAVGLAD
ncbi:PLP-dependent aminotransferase family protein [Nonomuraea sp. NPDC049480]|uniref:MocR-like pyridoxine biosynthesis transcription factor PdxR n=1 Tax=Nonomuraea sp. NPDC049480 TaxID=3364353 RepID=UPI0037A88C81